MMFYAVLYVVVAVFVVGILSKTNSGFCDWVAYSILIALWPMTLVMVSFYIPFVVVFRLGRLVSEYILDVLEDASILLTS